MAWLGQARPGSVLAYHRGFLATDRAWSASPALDRLAARIAWAAGQGWVELVQRRHGPEDSTYLAIARSGIARFVPPERMTRS